MPGESEFTSSRKFLAGAYCIPGFFDNSSVKLRLIHMESPLQEKFTSGKVTSRFLPSIFARSSYGPFPPRDLRISVLSLPSRGSPSGKPTLPCSYLNSRSTLSQVRFAHSRPSLCREGLSRALTMCYFFFLFFSDESEVESAPFPLFRR